MLPVKPTSPCQPSAPTSQPPGPPGPTGPPKPLGPVGPVELPLLGDRHERGDAAANRQRILTAARALLEAHGPEGVSMDAVAATAGVGKGTVFRRFGDRAGLMSELVDGYMRDFQDAFLSGPPPLGPGAPPADRLTAFLAALIELQREHLPIALAGQARRSATPDLAYGALHLHAATLILQIDPSLNAEILSTMLLGAIAPPVLNRLSAETDATVEAMVKLLQGITGAGGSGTAHRRPVGATAVRPPSGAA